MQSNEWAKIKEVFVETIELPEQQRRSFLANYDLAIQTQVNKLLKSYKKLDDFIEMPAIDEVGLIEESLIGKSIGDYKIAAIIGEGGMGIVYLAERQDFEQKVALKIVKRGMDTRAILKRFYLERQILSRLNHPNIARLLDGGTTDDGLPYFVMEYVEGESLLEFCANHAFEVDERLELFRKVCDAVSFAHQNLVVHRDLKPSNIIITNDGTPKLLDFGIAKLLDTDTENTATQARIFTPEYASPEQLNGLPITTSADVYSLGVLLYELLSGVRPFQTKSKNYAEIANLVLTEEPVRPSSVVSGQWSAVENTDKNKGQRTKDEGRITNPKSKIQNLKSLRGDLDNIILKAIRKEPNERYASVEQFSEDIRRHMVGLPVNATADSPAYRLGKYVKRHKSGVLAAMLVLLSLVGGISVATWQAIVAQRERAKAEQRFNDVRKLANSVIFEYQDAINNLAGATEISEKMLNDAVVYLDRLSTENVEDTELQLELAKAYVKVGGIQGNTFNANRSRFDLAEESYRKALALNEKALAQNPNDDTILKQLAENYSHIAAIKRIQGNLDVSVEHYKKTADIFRELLEKNPDDVGNLTAFASTQINIATQREEPHQVEESLRICRDAVDIYERLLAADPTNKALKSRRLGGYDALADVLMAIPEKRGEALNLYYKMIALFEEEQRAKPDDLRMPERIAITHSYVADALHLTGKDAEAHAEYKKSLELYDALIKADPKNDYAVLVRDYVQTFFAKFLVNRGNYGEAVNLLHEPLKNLPARLEKDPREFTSDFVFAMANHAYGTAQLNLHKNDKGKLKSAEESLQKSISIYEKYFGKVIIPRMSAADFAADARQNLEAIKNLLGAGH